MREYEIKVTRDGRFWLIYVPEIDHYTQARHPGEVEEMARSLIAVCTEQPIGDIAVHISK